MKTFTNCAEKKAKQFLNLLQGYTKGIRITAILLFLLMGVSNAWAATQRYIYVGISDKFDAIKTDGQWGFNFWGGTEAGVKSGTWIENIIHDGRQYHMFRVQVYDDNNKAQFKVNNNWWEPDGGINVTLNGTNNNAIFFTHGDDGGWWRWQQDYQVTSSVSLKAGKTSALVGESVTLTPSLTSNTTYNTLKSTSYEISPNTGASISSNTFKATKAGTYTVTATVTYNAKDFTGITKTATVTQTIKVYDTQYVLRGSQTANGDPKGGMAGWDATNNNAYTSATINGTTMTIVANLTNAKTQYKFKIYNNFDGSYYGQTGSAEIPNNTSWTLNGSNDVKFTTTAAGPYTFIYNTSNKSIKVQYPTAYTVTFSRTPTAAADAPTSSISSGAYVLANTSLTFTAKTAKTGYTWKGWYDNNDNELSSNQSYTRSITANTTIYAVYTANTYTVKFDANGGTGTMSNQNFTYGTAQNLTANTFTRTGYTFAGWATSANGNKVYNDKQSVSNLSSTNGATVTLYAKWTPVNYTITYNTNGGSGTMTPTSYTIETATFDLPTPTKDGCTFAGWYANAELTGDVVTKIAKGSYGNKTFYAKWDAKKFTLKWDPNGGTITTPGSPEGGEVEAGTPLKAPTVTKEHYDNTGWNPEVPAVMPGEDVTYTAIWTPKEYKITYNLNGGNGTMTPATYTIESETFTLPNNPTKTGHTFAGWYANAELTGDAVIQIEKGSTGDKVYWAKWNVASYTITLDPQGGTGGTTTITTLFEANLPAITIPSREDHLFDGYYTQTGGKGTKYYNADGTTTKTMPHNVSTLYAKWIPYSQCIFFKNNLNWSDVYVYFYSSDKYWDGDKGTGSKKEKEINESKAHYREFRDEMTNITGTDIWYLDYKTMATNVDATYAYEIDNCTNIAFTKDQQYNYEFFDNTEVVRRGDFNHDMQLFVPLLKTKQTADEKNKHDGKVTKYYSSGIWMKYNSTESGYDWRGATDENNQEQWSKKFNFTASKPGGYSFTATVEFDNTSTHYFKIHNTKGDWFGNGGTMTQNNCTDWTFGTDNTKNATITPTITGKYIFTIYLGDGEVSVSLDYPLSVYDYRLVYVDDVDDVTRVHPGHYIKKRNEDRLDTVSFFVHHQNSPRILLQHCTAISNSGVPTWKTDKEYQILKTGGADPTSAQLPGKRKSDAVLYTGEGCGIETSGVYNFILKQSGNDAELATDLTHAYVGDFYIRTDAAEGGWDSFRQAGNKMTYSSYADKNQDFDHYFCKWITQGTNIKFVIANEYSLCISDTLNGDDIVGNTGEHIGYLPADANVRFGWDGKTNEVSRAYISGSGKSQDRFLVLTGNEYLLDIKGKAIPEGTEADNRLGLNEHELLFSDKQNWIYQLDVKANSNTEITLTAQYNEETQTFFSTSKSGEVMQATNDDYHKVRMIYDFKTNNLIAAWLLETPVQETEAESVASNMLIIREDQGDANQINFTQNQNMEIYTAYAVMTFTQEWVKGANTRDRSEYWVSFPFDVNLSDVFGFSEYGDQWIMLLYDGAARAKEGYWAESKGFWKYITNRNYTLEAGVGYVLKLNPSKMTFDYGATDVSLFFPSQGIPTVINAEPTPIEVPAHTCTIERDNRKIYDSHWNLIGVPGYANLDDVNTKYTTGNQAENVNFYYEYNIDNNTYKTAAATGDFKNMYAYMVQFAGTIDWTNAPQFNTFPQQLAARHNSDTEPEKRTLRLEIAQGEEVADQTFVQLQQEGATPEFDMNLDLTKIINSGANIYTLAGDARIQVAGNALPIAETTIPVGVQMATAGEYTFRMPDGTEGMVVELIDYETNTRTNLLLSDYTTTLPQGICENRFALSVKPDKVATDVENIGETVNGSEAAKKYIIDGKLFLQKNGMLYDAQGHIVR